MLTTTRQTQRQPRSIHRRLQPQRIALAVFGLIGLFAVLGYPQTLRSAVYVPSPDSPPNGDIGIPLNISPTLQTKEGALFLTGGLTIASPTGNPNLTIGGSICWNDPGDRSECLTTWPTATAPSESLVAITPQPSDQAGWIDLVGPTASVNPIALNVTSGVPTTVAATYAAVGQADLLTSNLASFGVYAAAGANFGSNYALYGSAPSSASWAGYFAGHVAILSPYDLIIGSGGAINGQSPTTSEVCLNNVCRTSWPTISDTYWAVNSGGLEAADPTWNLAVGGNSSTADLFIEKIAATSTVIFRTDGAGTSTDLTVQ